MLGPVSHPTLVHTADDLGAALAAAYEKAGAPPLRDLDLPGQARLPLATASRIVNRKSLPATVEQMVTVDDAPRDDATLLLARTRKIGK